MDGPGAVAGVALGPAVPGQVDTWSASRPDGSPCEVVVVRLPPDTHLRSEALAALRVLTGGGLGHRQVVLDVTLCRVGVAVIAEPLAGTPATTLRHLTAAQAVTFGRPLARELVELHRAGAALGAPTLSGEVVVDSVGRPVLAIGPLARRLAGGPVGSPDDDRRSLVAVIDALVPPGDDAVRRRLTTALDASDCLHLAAALARVARPRPLLPSSTRHRRSTRRLTLGRARGGVFLGLAVAAVALVGWFSVRNPSASASVPSPSVVPGSTPDWPAVLGELDAQRVAYYGGTGTVEAVDVPGSQAARDDAGRRHALQDKQLRPDALHPVIAGVQVVRTETETVELLVTDTLPLYRLVRADGSVAAVVPARGTKVWRVTLRRADPTAGWRYAEVAAA